jgi:hypothetical protein
LSILIPLAASADKHPWTASWFLIPSIVAGALGLLGGYMLVGVYTGWRLPTTASERSIRRFESELGALVRTGQEFYERQVTSDEEFEALANAYVTWLSEGTDWITRHVSVSKAEEFAFPKGMAASIRGSYDLPHNDLRLKTSWQLKILTGLSGA